MVSKVLLSGLLLTSSFVFTFPVNAGFEEEGEVLNISVKKLMRASQKGKISVQGIRCLVENVATPQLDAISKNDEPLKVSARKKEGAFHFFHKAFSVKITPFPAQSTPQERVEFEESKWPILTGLQLEKGYRAGRLDTNHGRFSVSSPYTPQFDKLHDKTRKFYSSTKGKIFIFRYATKFNSLTNQYEDATIPSLGVPALNALIAFELHVRKIN